MMWRERCACGAEYEVTDSTLKATGYEPRAMQDWRIRHREVCNEMQSLKSNTDTPEPPPAPKPDRIRFR